MTREMLLFIGSHQKSLTYGHVTKIESEFQRKGNKQTKKMQILSKILGLSRQEQIQKILLFKYTEKDKEKLELSSLGQESTFELVFYKVCKVFAFMTSARDYKNCHKILVVKCYFEIRENLAKI